MTLAGCWRYARISAESASEHHMGMQHAAPQYMVDMWSGCERYVGKVLANAVEAAIGNEGGTQPRDGRRQQPLHIETQQLAWTSGTLC